MSKSNVLKLMFHYTAEGLKMQTRYIEKNVDLNLLVNQIEVFFKDKGYKTVKDELRGKYKIMAFPQLATDIPGKVNVSVTGDPNDFLVRLTLSGAGKNSTMLGFLTAPFGGGGLLVRSLKSQEALEKLEKGFWPYLDEVVENFKDSAASRA